MKQTVSIALVAALIGTTVNHSARAQSFAPAASANYTMDLDTQNGNFSVWQVNDLSAINALRSNVTIARLGQDPKWAPTFLIMLNSDAGRAELHISGLDGRLILTAESWVGEEQMQSEVFLLPPEIAETFGLDVDWSPDGSVVFVVRDKAAGKVNGYERHVISLMGPPTTLEITSSTGQLKLDQVKLGRTTP